MIILSIPNFMQKEKIEHLLERIEKINVDKNNGSNTSQSNSNKPNVTEEDQNQNNKPINPDKSNSDEQDNNISQSKPNNSVDENNNSIDAPNNQEKEENIKPPVQPQPVTYTANFVGNGATINESMKSCQTTTNNCVVTAPNIISDKEVLGWSTDANATTAAYKVNENISLSNNVTFYAITKKTVTLTVDGNGAFDGIQYLNCSFYNQNTFCSVTLPTLNKDFYTQVGFNTDKNSEDLIYNNGAVINLTDNLTLYGMRKIDTSQYNLHVTAANEMVSKINELRINNGLNKLEHSKSLELSAMLRISEIAQDYYFTVNNNRHYRISNNQPFYTVNELAYAENFHRRNTCIAQAFHDDFVASESHLKNMLRSDITIVGISVNYIGEYCYVVELFG